MNTKILMTMLALGVSTQAFSHETVKNYNGWTLGVDGGWVGSSLKAKSNTSSSFVNIKNLNQASFGVHTDWHRTLANHMYFGFGLGAGFHSGDPSKTLDSETTNGKTVNTTFKQQRNFYAELAGRLGWNFNNAIVYAMAVVKTTHMKHTYQLSDGSNNYSDKKFINAFGPGAGFDFKVGKDWSFGAEYRYMFEESTDFVDGNVPGVNAKLSRLRSHNVIGRVSYHF